MKKKSMVSQQSQIDPFSPNQSLYDSKINENTLLKLV